MKITHLECWPIEFTLPEPFTIAYESLEHFTNVVLKATTDTGLIGWSCAAPDKMITGETADDVLSSFNEIIEPLFKDADFFRYAYLNEELQKRLAGRRSAKAMADMLLYDLMARVADQPLYRMLGGYRNSIITSMTISILPVDTTIQRAAEYVSKGFKCLKLKGGLDVEEDIEKTIKVRERVGSHIELRFDANQGYSIEDAVRYVKDTTVANVELLEQPTPTELESQLEQVVLQTSIPVMADESLKSLRDVFRLVKNDRADMINIKLMKVGGISDGVHINSVARAAGVECMVGCLDECALGIAFGLHFCLSRPNLIYADLDSSYGLANDPFADLVTINDGSLYPQSGPGIGSVQFD